MSKVFFRIWEATALYDLIMEQGVLALLTVGSRYQRCI